MNNQPAWLHPEDFSWLGNRFSIGTNHVEFKLDSAILADFEKKKNELGQYFNLFLASVLSVLLGIALSIFFEHKIICFMIGFVILGILGKLLYRITCSCLNADIDSYKKNGCKIHLVTGKIESFSNKSDSITNLSENIITKETIAFNNKKVSVACIVTSRNNIKDTIVLTSFTEAHEFEKIKNLIHTLKIKIDQPM